MKTKKAIKLIEKITELDDKLSSDHAPLGEAKLKMARQSARLQNELDTLPEAVRDQAAKEFFRPRT